ncbi:MAG: MFS transporter [Thermotaleaceae bacterium]
MAQLDQAKVKKLLTYRWAIWGVLVLSYIIVFFHRLAVGVVQEDLVETFHISGTTYAHLGSTYFYAYLLMQIPAGVLADSLGTRMTVAIGTFVAGVGSIIFGFAPSISIAFLGRLLVGLGVSVVFIPILKIQTQWFREREFGTMSGITSFVGNMGGIIAQAPLALLAAAITWRYAFAAMGIVSFVVAGLCYVIVRNEPEDMGLPSIREIEGKPAPQNNGKPHLLKGLIAVMANWRSWPSFVMFGGFFGGYVALTGTWGRAYMVEVYGISTVSAAHYMTAAVFGLAIGSVVIGKISDRLQKRKLPMLMAGAVYVLCWVILVFVNGGKPPIAIMGPLFFILGFTCSTYVLGWACTKEVNPPQIAGISTSVVNIGGFIGSAVLPPLMGSVIDRLGGQLLPAEVYQKAFLLCLGAGVLGYAATFLVQETHCKNIYQER